MFDCLFQLSKRDSSVPKEVLAGITTFLAMAYILVVQPAVLSVDFAGNPTGLDAGAVLLATCLASAFASALMGLYARLPIALAPGMGTNFFFVSVVMALSASGAAGQPWQSALGIVLVSGVLFFVLTVIGVRKFVLDVMSPGLRNAITVGIGIFIALIGLKNANIVVDGPTLVTLNAKGLTSVDSQVFWLGFMTTLILMARRIPGSMLVGMIGATAVAWMGGKIAFDRVIGLPEIRQSAVFQVDFRAVFSAAGVSYVAVFLFMDIFDTTGTLIGVTQQAGLMEDGQVPRLKEAMIADSAGTVVGACLGTSTVTCFIESAAGVEQGGRTGLTAVVVAVLFLIAIPFSPLLIALGAYKPITAPALVIVGAMMFRNVKSIDWSDDTEAVPAFLVILGIPLFFSIADGIALGLIIWPVLKVARGQSSSVPKGAWGIAVVLAAYFLFVRTNIS